LASNVTNNLSVQTEVHIDSKTKDALASSNSFNVDYFNVLGFVIIASLITGVSVVMFSFHGLDIRRRHTASPITIRNMNFQLILANLVYALSLLLLYVVFGYLQNENRIVNTNTWLTWINAVVFTVTCLSISYLVGITVNSRKTVQAISTALSLGLAFLSGMFVPQQYLGDTVLKIASFTPSFWYVKANNTIGNITTFHWSDIGQIIGYMAIQLGFAIAIISIALVVSKRKTQQTT